MTYHIRQAIRFVLHFVLRHKADKLFFEQDPETGLSRFTRFGYWVYLGSKK